MRKCGRIATASKKLFLAALVPLALWASFAHSQTKPPESSLNADLERLLNWFGGEWDNNEQVWQQKADVKAAEAKGSQPSGSAVEDKIPHTHHIFAPVVAPKMGMHVYYIQQHLDADMSKAYRQRIYRFSTDEQEQAIKLEIFTPLDEKTFFNAHLSPTIFAELEATSLRQAVGCEVYWRYQPAKAEFIGTMKPGACGYHSQRLGKRIVISDTLKLSASEIWINDQARDESGNYVFGSKTDTPVKNRKVRYFTGWVYLNRAGKAATDTDKTFSFRRDLLLHNEGQVIPLQWDDGAPSPYLLELANLTYQNTRTPILKLAVLDRETKKSVAYIWANTDANRIGMNLGWVQVGLTQKESRTAYGFGDPPRAP